MKPDDVRYWMGADDFGPCIKYVRCLGKASRGQWRCEIDDGEQITEILWTKKEFLRAPFTRIEEAEAALAGHAFVQKLQFDPVGSLMRLLGFLPTVAQRLPRANMTESGAPA